jgi:hypothetical protein
VAGLYRVDRRTLLADLGWGPLAVAVLGWTACGGDDDDDDDGLGAAAPRHNVTRDDARINAIFV